VTADAEVSLAVNETGSKTLKPVITYHLMVCLLTIAFNAIVLVLKIVNLQVFSLPQLLLKNYALLSV